MPNTIFWDLPVSRKADIGYIRILRGDSDGGPFETLVVLQALDQGNPPFFIGEYIDFNGLDTHYYQYQFLGKGATPEILFTSDPILFNSYATLVELVSDLRYRIKDLNPEQFGFTFWELYRKLEQSIRMYDYDLTWGTLCPADRVACLIMAHIDACYELATNSAKYYRIHAGEAECDKSTRVNYYMQIARGLKDDLMKDMERQGLGLNHSMIEGTIPAHKYPNRYSQTGIWQRVVDTRLEIPSESTGQPTPVISNIDVPSISSTEALITWETNVNSDTKVEWWRDSSDKRVTPTYNNQSGTRVHSVKLTALNPATKYYFKCYSGATVSDTQEFTTS